MNIPIKLKDLISLPLPSIVDFTPNRKTPTEEKLLLNFWLKVDIKTKKQCWNWQGAQSGKGIRAENRIRGSFVVHDKSYVASRFAYIVCVGDPGDLQVCHSCDNGLCCNPYHLFLGTNDDNMKDMVKKNRQAIMIGLKSPRAKLNERQIHEIYRLKKNGIKIPVIAKRFGVCKSTVHYLFNKTTYTDVPR